MKIASIDIGTNAIKSKIFKTTPTSIEFIEGMRSPIRLGSEVFNEGKLSQKKLDQGPKDAQEGAQDEQTPAAGDQVTPTDSDVS